MPTARLWLCGVGSTGRRGSGDGVAVGCDAAGRVESLNRSCLQLPVARRKTKPMFVPVCNYRLRAGTIDRPDGACTTPGRRIRVHVALETALRASTSCIPLRMGRVAMRLARRPCGMRRCRAACAAAAQGRPRLAAPLPYFVYAPSGSISSRMRRSSSAVGAGVTASGSARRDSQPIVSRIWSSVAPGWIESRRISPSSLKW